MSLPNLTSRATSFDSAAREAAQPLDGEQINSLRHLFDYFTDPRHPTKISSRGLKQILNHCGLDFPISTCMALIAVHGTPEPDEADPLDGDGFITEEEQAALLERDEYDDDEHDAGFEGEDNKKKRKKLKKKSKKRRDSVRPGADADTNANELPVSTRRTSQVDAETEKEEKKMEEMRQKREKQRQEAEKEEERRGGIDFNQFLLMYAKFTKNLSSHQEMKEVFRILDDDHDGYVSVDCFITTVCALDDEQHHRHDAFDPVAHQKQRDKVSRVLASCLSTSRQYTEHGRLSYDDFVTFMFS